MPSFEACSLIYTFTMPKHLFPFLSSEKDAKLLLSKFNFA